jgi:hypothetical protein
MACPTKPDGSPGGVKHLLELPWMCARKIELPYEWRTEVIATLSKMNITGETLFPGMDGLGRTTGTYLQTGFPTSMREYLDL